MNRKDITIVVAKENGRDQQINTVARRVMLLAEKNTARFAKANAKRVERQLALAQVEQEIQALEAELKSKVAQIEDLQVQLKAKKEHTASDAKPETSQESEYTVIAQMGNKVTVAYADGRVATIPKSQLAKSNSKDKAESQAKSEAVLNTKIDKIVLEFAEAYDGRYQKGQVFHTLGELQTQLKAMYPLEELKQDGVYNKVYLQFHLDDGKAKRIEEWRMEVGLKEGAFNPHDGSLVLEPDLYNWLMSEGVVPGDYWGKVGNVSTNAGNASEANEGWDGNQKEPVAEGWDVKQNETETLSPIEITGKELGDFDTNTQEGKKALREAAFDYLKGLAQNGESVYCSALNADVGFSKAGAKKFKSTSSNPVKSKLVAQIKSIIQQGVQFKDSKRDYQGERMTFHYLKTAVRVEDVVYGVRTVIREDANGQFHYDMQIKDSIDAIMDDVKNGKATSKITNGFTATYKPSAQQDAVMVASGQPYSPARDVFNTNAFPLHSQALYDNADEEGGWVLNLFLTDANGNPIPDEEEDWEEETPPEGETSESEAAGSPSDEEQSQIEESIKNGGAIPDQYMIKLRNGLSFTYKQFARYLKINQEFDEFPTRKAEADEELRKAIDGRLAFEIAASSFVNAYPLRALEHLNKAQGTGNARAAAALHYEEETFNHPDYKAMALIVKDYFNASFDPTNRESFIQWVDQWVGVGAAESEEEAQKMREQEAQRKAEERAQKENAEKMAREAAKQAEIEAKAEQKRSLIQLMGLQAGTLATNRAIATLTNPLKTGIQIKDRVFWTNKEIVDYLIHEEGRTLPEVDYYTADEKDPYDTKDYWDRVTKEEYEAQKEAGLPAKIEYSLRTPDRKTSMEVNKTMLEYAKAVLARQETPPQSPSDNPKKDSDKAFLNRAITGEADILEDSFGETLEAIAERWIDSGDEEMEDLVNRAAEVYAQQLDTLSA